MFSVRTAFLLLALPLFAQDSGVISGTVRNSVTHQALEDVQVSLIGADSTGAQTDTRGSFRFSGMPAGKYSLRIEKPGFRAPEPREIATGADSITLELDPLAQIEGRVTDEDGHPVSGITVDAVNPTGFSAGWLSGEPTTASGEFLLQNLPPGDHWIRLRIPAARRADGYPAEEYYPGVAESQQAVSIRVTQGQQIAGLTIRLRRVPLVTLRGRVIDLAKDESARPKEVALDSEPGPIGNSFARHEVNAEGRFQFEGVPPGRHRLLIYRGTGSDDLPYSTMIDAEKDEVEVNLPPFARVEGVVKSSLQPWEGVLGIGVAMDGAWRRNVTPGEDGSFTLSNLPPGKWSLRIESNNLHAGDRTLRLASAVFGEVNVVGKPMTVTEGGNPPLVITLTDAVGGIAGAVEAADQKDEMMVFAVPADGRPLESESVTRTGPDGAFSLPSLIPGKYQVSAWGLTFLRATGYGADCTERTVNLTVTAGQTAAVKLKRCNP